MSRRQVTKQADMKFSLAAEQKPELPELLEVINNQRGRDQHIGWGVIRGGKVYIVGTSEQHARMNLNSPNVLNIPPA